MANLLPAGDRCIVEQLAQRRGYALAQRSSWLRMLLYAVAVSSTVYVVLALDNPRFGCIHLASADNALVRGRDSIRATSD